MTDCKRGDRVKVTIEGTVERVDTVRNGTIKELRISTQQEGGGPHQFVYLTEGVEAEVIAPPPRPYQVGDRVRGAYVPTTEWVLGQEGYFVVKCGFRQAVGTFHLYDGSLEDNFPTGSRNYELVEAAES